MTHKDNVLKRYGLPDGSYSKQELSKITKVPLKIIQEVYNRGIGAYKTNPESVRLKGSFKKGPAPMSKKLSKEQWAMARVYSFLDGNPKHDNDLRGGAWYDDAWNSVQSGWGQVANEFTNPESYLQQGVGQVTNEFTNPESLLRGEYLPKLGNEFSNSDSLLRAQYLGQAADGVSKAAPILDILGEQMGLGKGVGKTMAEVLKGAQEVNKAAKSVGYGKKRGGKKGALDYVSEYVPESRDAISQAKGYAPLLKMLLKGQAPQYSSHIDQGAEMLGLGRKVGGSAKSSRKPSARNEVVKRVMAERGCSLPQASSIVKREGLY